MDVMIGSNNVAVAAIIGSNSLLINTEEISKPRLIIVDI